MPEIEIHVRSLLINETFKGDVPDEVLKSAKNVLSTTSGEERDRLFEIGDRWARSGGEDERVLRATVFDNLAGLGYESIPLAERVTNLESDIGESGGRQTRHIYDTSLGTGFSGHGKWPRDL